MSLQEIKENLCYYDPRNPDNVLDSNMVINNECYCDNCFRGCTKLAEELLKLINET